MSASINTKTSYLNAKQTSWKGPIDKSGLVGEHSGAFENDGIGIEAGYIFNDHKLRAWKEQFRQLGKSWKVKAADVVNQIARLLGGGLTGQPERSDVQDVCRHSADTLSRSCRSGQAQLSQHSTAQT